MGLFDALPRLVESDNNNLTAQLDIFFSSESNDNLVTSTPNDKRHPIDVFHAAYVRLKRTRSASLLVSDVDLVCSLKRDLFREIKVIKKNTANGYIGAIMRNAVMLHLIFVCCSVCLDKQQP